MFKRLTLLLIAIILCGCVTASAEEALKDFPLMVSQSSVQLSDYHLDAPALLPPGSVELLLDDFDLIDVETDSEAVYLVLTYDETVGALSATMTMEIDGYITEPVDGELCQAPSGQAAMRFGVKDAPSAVVKGFAVSLTRDTATSTVAYDRDLSVTGLTFEDNGPAQHVLIELSDANQLQHYVLQQEGVRIDATYTADDQPDYTLVTTSSPERIYYFEGSALSTIRDDEHGIIAHYDLDTGMLMRYTVSSAVEGGTQRATFSPYGDLIQISYPHLTEDWTEASVCWAPNFGWYLPDEEDAFAVDASELPDPATIVPPLPVVARPEYSTETHSVADLPKLPRAIDELPEVLDLQVAGGVATVTLNRSLTLPNAVPAVRPRWNPDSDVILASPTETAGVYIAEVDESVTREDLCFDIFIPADDLSSFSYGYAYDPRTETWQVTAFSPAAEFVLECSPEGTILTAQITDFTCGDNDECHLTFNEEGVLTSFEFFIKLPFAAHRGDWYAFTYEPGQGVVSAICGDRSTGRYVWSPDTGWKDLVLDAAPEGLLDPLTFLDPEHPYPFPFPSED